MRTRCIFHLNIDAHSHPLCSSIFCLTQKQKHSLEQVATLDKCTQRSSGVPLDDKEETLQSAHVLAKRLQFESRNFEIPVRCAEPTTSPCNSVLPFLMLQHFPIMITRGFPSNVDSRSYPLYSSMFNSQTIALPRAGCDVEQQHDASFLGDVAA